MSKKINSIYRYYAGKLAENLAEAEFHKERGHQK